MNTNKITYFNLYSIYLILVTCFLFTPHILLSQNRGKEPSKKTQELYSQGIRFLQEQKSEKAKISFRKAIAEFPNFTEAHITLGDILRKENLIDSAIEHYILALEINSELTSHTYFGLGECYLFQGNYSLAQKNLKKFLEKSKRLPLSATESLAQKYLKDCEFSLHEISLNKEIIHFNKNNSINSVDDEYFPHLTADFQKIIFTRKNEDQENFYESTRIEDGSYSSPSLLQGEINSIFFNEGAHCISPDGKYLFFTGCNRPDGLGSCDIYVSKLENGIWGAPFNLGMPINTKGWESQPSISADGKTLYFVSNRAGGFGGYDIWKSNLLENGKWSNPTNLGPQINTPYDESAPFIHADNETLFFTSNGWPGFGRKDFFKSKYLGDKEWSMPKNLGFPINNHLDQSSITFSMNGQVAVFSSPSNNQNTNLDINFWNVPENSRPARVAFINGKILDANNHQPLDAEVKIFSLNKNKEIYSDFSDYEDGKFIAPLPYGDSYTFHVLKKGYLLQSEHFSLKNLDGEMDEIELEFHLQSLTTGSSEILNNIFFDVDKAELKAESFRELEILYNFLLVNQTTVIEIGGHTDNTGSKERNEELSVQRAKNVFNFLIEKGLPPNRISYKGYGSTNPIETNSTEEGRQKNRRTDFKIIRL